MLPLNKKSMLFKQSALSAIKNITCLCTLHACLHRVLIVAQIQKLEIRSRCQIQNIDLDIHYRHNKRQYPQAISTTVSPSKYKQKHLVHVSCLHFCLQDGSEFGATVENIDICVVDLGYGSKVWVLDLCYRKYMLISRSSKFLQK